MIDNTPELLKIIEEQGKQIKKLISAAMTAEKRMMMLDKKIARVQHQSRDHTNTLNFMKRKMGRE